MLNEENKRVYMKCPMWLLGGSPQFEITSQALCGLGGGRTKGGSKTTTSRVRANLPTRFLPTRFPWPWSFTGLPESTTDRHPPGCTMMQSYIHKRGAAPCSSGPRSAHLPRCPRSRRPFGRARRVSSRTKVRNSDNNNNDNNNNNNNNN